MLQCFFYALHHKSMAIYCEKSLRGLFFSQFAVFLCVIFSATNDCQITAYVSLIPNVGNQFVHPIGCDSFVFVEEMTLRAL